MKTYSGKFTPVNPLKYRGDVDNITYRSLWERHAFVWADMNSSIVKWSSEEVIISYVYEADKKFHRYFTDLWLRFADGKTLLVEIKPFKETQVPEKPPRKTARFVTESLTYIKNQNKWAAATKYAVERGWEFVVWTEHELFALGIMPKVIPRMKALSRKKSLKKIPIKKSVTKK